MQGFVVVASAPVVYSNGKNICGEPLSMSMGMKSISYDGIWSFRKFLRGSFNGVERTTSNITYWEDWQPFIVNAENNSVF